MKQSSTAIRFGLTFLLVTAVVGCTHDALSKPTMQQGNGAIKGKLVDGTGEPFDVSLAGDGGAKTLQIQLISSTAGVVATTTPGLRKPEFVFNNVPPGRYELTVYDIVRDQRTVAGNQTVTVDPGQTTSATMTLQVSEQK